MSDYKQEEQEFSFKSLFSPLTISKAIHIIIIIGFMVFGNALFNGFVWDDIGYILINPEIHNPNVATLFGGSAFNSSGYYRPIPAAYFTISHSLFNSNAFFYHFIQISLHIINVCLIFYLLQKFFSKKISIFLSLIFLVHPIQVESVSYIGATQSELFFLFGVISLLLSIKETPSKKHIVLMSGFLLLSLLTKELGFLFLIMIFVFQYLFKKRKLLLLLPFLFSTTIIYFLIRFIIGGVYFEKITLAPIGRLSFIERLINIPDIIFYYIKLFFTLRNFQ